MFPLPRLSNVQPAASAAGAVVLVVIMYLTVSSPAVASVASTVSTLYILSSRYRGFEVNTGVPIVGNVWSTIALLVITVVFPAISVAVIVNVWSPSLSFLAVVSVPFDPSGSV